MGLTKIPKNEIILSSRNYLNNAATDPTISRRLASRGYDASRIEEGHILQKKAWSSRLRQLAAMNKAKGLHKDFKKVFATQRKLFMDEVMIFRCTFFRDEAAQQVLGLPGKKKRDMKGYLEEARAFYATFNKEPGLLKKVEKFNFTASTVKERLDGLKGIEQAYFTYFNAQKEAQIATAENNRDVRDLQDWLRVFQAVCKAVLTGKPQYLAKIGVASSKKSTAHMLQVSAALDEDESRERENAPARLSSCVSSSGLQVSTGSVASGDTKSTVSSFAGKAMFFRWLAFFYLGYINKFVTIKNPGNKGRLNRGYFPRDFG